MKNTLLTTLLLLCLSTAMFGQLTVTKFPQDKQLFPRKISTNQGIASITGTVDNAGCYFSAVRVKLFRDVNLLSTTDQQLNFSALGIANFSFNVPITAELVNYKVELYGVDAYGEILLQRASELVAGDAFIIDGETNAVANNQLLSMNLLSTVTSPFIRSFGSSSPNNSPIITNDKAWYQADGDASYARGAIGQWGLKTARTIVDNQKIPVAVINGAVGGTHIQQHMPNTANRRDLSTIYGRLLSRVTDAGLNNRIRAIWWHQGESDATLGRNVSTYKSLFTSLKNQWMTDFPSVEHIFTFQIRQGCGNTVDNYLNIAEAQRQLAVGNVHVVATNGATQNTDNCHFLYNLGYELFASRLSAQLASYLYNAAPAQDMLAPDVQKATLIAPNVIELTFANLNSATMVFIPGTNFDFRLEGLGSGVSVVKGVAIQNKVYLILASIPALPSTISYFGHQGVGSPYISTLNNNAALSFSQMNLTEAPMITMLGTAPTTSTELAQVIEMVEAEEPALAASIRQNIADARTLSVSPNPANNESTVSLPTGDQWNQLEVIDITGRTVMARPFTAAELDAQKSTIEVDALQAGQYFVRITGNSSSQSVKLLIQH